MFTEKVATVTLDKSRISFNPTGDGIWTMIPDIERILVEDVGIDCSLRSMPYLPDYVIQGYFLMDPDRLHPVYTVNREGPDLLYVTGIPKSIPHSEKEKFLLPDLKWLSYWEDKYTGYLFQVISRDKALQNLINIKKPK